MDLKNVMLKLGWSDKKYDGSLWFKGDLDKMTLEQAIVNELERLYTYNKTLFICPDCGYNISTDEFIRQQFE